MTTPQSTATAAQGLRYNVIAKQSGAILGTWAEGPELTAAIIHFRKLLGGRFVQWARA